MFAATVPGGAGSVVTLTFDQQNFAFAQSLANSISQQVQNGSLFPIEYLGAPLPSSKGQNREVVIKADGPLVLSKTDTAVVDIASNSVVFGGGASNEEVLSNSADFTFFTDGGSGSLVTGDGRNTIVETGDKNQSWNIATGNAGDLVIINGGTNTVAAGGGTNRIQLNDGNNLVHSTGLDFIDAVSGSDTIVSSSSAPEIISAGKADIFYTGGSGPTTLTGGQGSDTVFASGGGYFQGGSAGNNHILTGSFLGGISNGPATIIGGGNGDQLYATGSSLTQIFAGSGNETLDGSLGSNSNTFHAGPGKDQVRGGTGNDTLFAGTGHATMTGSTGADTFDFIKGMSSTVTILDFSAAQGDTIRLQGFGPNQAQLAIGNAKVHSDGTTVTLSDNTKITFAEVTNLTKSDFS